MKWNWQRADWPRFRYRAEALAALESRFLRQFGELCGAIRHLTEGDRQVLAVELISEEGVRTAAIEGETLNRESLQSSIRRQFGLQTGHRRVPAAEQGMAEMMVNVYRTFDEPLTHAMLNAWHGDLVQGRRDLAVVGGYRKGDEPMRVVSGDVGEPVVNFEAPPSSRVKAEMNTFITWFKETSPDGKAPLSPLARAGMAHLHFVSIHPFEDGNGRIGRAIAEKALAQSLGQPTLIALAYTIERSRKAYYAALAEANQDNEITAWLTYFAQTALDAGRRTLSRIEFLIAKTKFYDRFRGTLNARQEKVLARLFDAGPDGFVGGLSAEKYIAITRTSRATATRDLADLVARDAVAKVGQLKGTRYSLKLLT